MCVVLCHRLFCCDCDLIVIEIERALKYINFFLREVTMIVRVTQHHFLLPIPYFDCDYHCSFDFDFYCDYDLDFDCDCDKAPLPPPYPIFSL